MSQPEYANRYPTLAFERFDDGVLVMRLQDPDGTTADYAQEHHEDWAPALRDIAADRENRVVIITGTGDAFIGSHGPWRERFTTPDHHEFTARRQKMQYDYLFQIDCPVIGAVNGPSIHHSELVVLNDIVLAADHAYFTDGHVYMGEPPADGAHIFWQELLGPNRGKYFLLTGHKITAQQAQEIGFVNEVMPLDELMPRALELAHQLATFDTLALRFMRRAFVSRWQRIFRDDVGVGYGMALEVMLHVDRAFNPWEAAEGENQGEDELTKGLRSASGFTRPRASKPRSLFQGQYGEPHTTD
ncbi:MAG: enoyl-CoA hydratase/isomerase family protein [Actinomycetota bacterium]|nr:MAG: enoyl-CoA hydratase/isomerase family protein [Actinomycetota bacterium]